MLPIIDLGAHFNPYAMNDLGHVVGFLTINPNTLNATYNAALWDPGSESVIDLRKVVDPSAAFASDVNNHGTVLVNSDGDYPYTWQIGDSALTGLGTADTPRCWLSEINDGGMIIAEWADLIVYRAGGKEPLHIMPPFGAGGPFDWSDLNNKGVAVGRVAGPDRDYAFSWTSAGGFALLGEGPVQTGIDRTIYDATAVNNHGVFTLYEEPASLIVSPDKSSVALKVQGTNVMAVDVNDQGRVVGTVGAPWDHSPKGYPFTAMGPLMIDLNTILPLPPKYILGSAIAINNKGWIVGEGFWDGEPHGWLAKTYLPSDAIARYPALGFVAQVIFGGRADSPGPFFGSLPPAQQDGVIGAALSELSQLLADRGAREAVEKVALERVRAGLEDAVRRMPHFVRDG